MHKIALNLDETHMQHLFEISGIEGRSPEACSAAALMVLRLAASANKEKHSNRSWRSKAFSNIVGLGRGEVVVIGPYVDRHGFSISVEQITKCFDDAVARVSNNCAGKNWPTKPVILKSDLPDGIVIIRY